jgi:hypothetical protein
MVQEFVPAVLALAIALAFLFTVIRLSHRW